MIALLAAHSGAHAAQHAAPIAALPLIFRRAVAAVRRKRAVPADFAAAGAATTLLADAVPVLERNERTLTSAEIAALTPASAVAHADAVHAMSARYLPAAPRHAHTLPRRKPMVNRQPWQTAEHSVYRPGSWE